MSEQYYVGATFDDHDRADAAIAELRSSGVSDKRMGLLVRGADDDRIGKQVDVQWGTSLAWGIGIGIPAGMLAGMFIVWIAMPATGLGLGATLAGGAIAGISLGMFFGGVFGLAADRSLAHEELVEEVEVEPDHVLVAAHRRGDDGRVAAILEAHGGTLVALA